MTVPLANNREGQAVTQLYRRTGRAKQTGFTLIEVLATLMLMAIVLPAIMQGISIASGTASAARCRNEAAGLAESKLNEVIATQQWQGGQMSGDFAPDFPQYKWQATVGEWQSDSSNVGLQQLDVKVIWTHRNREDSVTVSTLTYVRAQQ
jgi:prepilin-type N-terminal cleavage/methylation domain-containing protein